MLYFQRSIFSITVHTGSIEFRKNVFFDFKPKKTSLLVLNTTDVSSLSLGLHRLHIKLHQLLAQLGDGREFAQAIDPVQRRVILSAVNDRASEALWAP